MASADRPYADAHKQLNGPGHSRPTALQAIKDEGLMGELKGRVFLVTGASSGIGTETARALHAAGAHVVMPVRNMQKGEAAVNSIEASNAQYCNGGELKLVHLDLDSLDSVRSFAEGSSEGSKAAYKQLNVLINNAGARQYCAVIVRQPS
jgi:NAD(P)-dependent dehydrogenase (short-subunit alcohol dehydrogenase family)